MDTEFFREWFSRNPLTHFFMILSALVVLIFIICALATGGNTLIDMFVDQPGDYFSDYFYSVATSYPDPYSVERVIYPPLVITGYALMRQYVMPFVDESGTQDLMYDIRDSQAGMMSYVFLLLSIAFVLLRLILHMSSTREAKILAFLVLFSDPFIHVVERGNVMILVMVLCLAFLLTYSSENRYVRYLSYVILGCAVGIKIYPVFLCVLYLRDGRYRHLLECLVVVCVLFFLPFVFTDGNPAMLLDNIHNHLGDPDGNSGVLFASTVVNVLSDCLSAEVLTVLGYLVTILMFALMLIPIVYDKGLKGWECVTLAVCMMMYGPGVAAWEYMTLLVAIPAIFMLKEERELSLYTMVIAVTLIFVLAPIPMFWDATGDIRAMKQFVLFAPLVCVLVKSYMRMRKNRESERIPESD